MKKAVSISLVLVVFALSAMSFTNARVINNPDAKASISGKVVDNLTGEALAGVTVSIEGTDVKAYTDLDGNFTIKSIDAGSYNLILSLISYKNSFVENLKIKTSENGVVSIKLDSVR